MAVVFSRTPDFVKKSVIIPTWSAPGAGDQHECVVSGLDPYLVWYRLRASVNVDIVVWRKRARQREQKHYINEFRVI